MLRNGAEYHVSARFNRNEFILSPRADKLLFLYVLKRARKKYRFRLENFCLMSSHFHFLIRPDEGESLSRIMQWILSVFARQWNRRHGMRGHVWGERFFSRIVEGVVDRVRVYMYIDRNPVEGGLAGEKEEWEYGGLWHHRKGRDDVVDRPGWFILSFLPEHGPA
jgi:putative transposase